MISFPNAKINLGLNIVEKREDGFHNIESCFYPIPWSDILEIVPRKKLSFQSTGIPIPGDPLENLCIKAFKLLANDFNINPVAIHLHKVIPIGAGLGGGSADAAFTLKGLNRLYNLHLEDDILCEYARKIGSDCAFFIKNEPVYATAKGDEFQSIQQLLRGKFLVVIYPDLHVSTGEAYAGIAPKQTAQNSAAILKSVSLDQWKDHLFNDFETTIFRLHPDLMKLKTMMYEIGALYASMSGSGSSIYGIFNGEPQIPSEFTDLPHWKGFL